METPSTITPEVLVSYAVEVARSRTQYQEVRYKAITAEKVATEALDALDKAQAVFDAAVEQFKESAPNGSRWELQGRA